MQTQRFQGFISFVSSQKALLKFVGNNSMHLLLQISLFDILAQKADKWFSQTHPVILLLKTKLLLLLEALEPLLEDDSVGIDKTVPPLISSDIDSCSIVFPASSLTLEPNNNPRKNHRKCQKQQKASVPELRASSECEANSRAHIWYESRTNEASSIARTPYEGVRRDCLTLDLPRGTPTYCEVHNINHMQQNRQEWKRMKMKGVQVVFGYGLKGTTGFKIFSSISWSTDKPKRIQDHSGTRKLHRDLDWIPIKQYINEKLLR
ncbi:hypothetical protein L484_022812 [Morus notabilis]|uniref:Uncharacterized protein n=1 Tax=Morus notabilis TaxID=981085 RepID=W9S583_9ROSA|nr:hypothetical protein L484_022812 [Morus notabilis]